MAKRPQLTGRAAVLAIVVCAIAMSLAYPVREYISQRRTNSELMAEKSRELEIRRQLEERYQQLQDPGYIKREARRRLHYCGAGEKCYVVMDDQPGQGQVAAEQKAAQVPPWYHTLLQSIEAADTGVGQKAVSGEKTDGQG